MAMKPPDPLLRGLTIGCWLALLMWLAIAIAVWLVLR
jgi:hypothetical protein